MLQVHNLHMCTKYTTPTALYADRRCFEFLRHARLNDAFDRDKWRGSVKWLLSSAARPRKSSPDTVSSQVTSFSPPIPPYSTRRTVNLEPISSSA